MDKRTVHCMNVQYFSYRSSENGRIRYKVLDVRTDGLLYYVTYRTAEEADISLFEAERSGVKDVRTTSAPHSALRTVA